MQELLSAPYPLQDPQSPLKLESASILGKRRATLKGGKQRVLNVSLVDVGHGLPFPKSI